LAGRKQRARRPRIYGDESNARRAIARYIASGQELLDQSVGVRNQIAEAKAKQSKKPKPRPKPKPRRAGSDSLDLAFLLPTFEIKVEDWIASDWIETMRSWRERAARPMHRYLQEQYRETLPALAHGPGWPISLDTGEPWLRSAVDELLHLQAALGIQRAIAPSPPAPTRFSELLGSGLVDAKVVNDHAKSMTTALRTAKQRSDAIGAAKELIEATLRGALDQLGMPPRSRDNLPTLMKAWRGAIGQAAPSRSGADVLARALNAQVMFLAEWRNRYGRGHGRTKYPGGVKARHARLAVDTTETFIRFVVTTMDDLQLLPP
jgi:Abortive infection C-terminus